MNGNKRIFFFNKHRSSTADSEQLFLLQRKWAVDVCPVNEPVVASVKYKLSFDSKLP